MWSYVTVCGVNVVHFVGDEVVFWDLCCVLLCVVCAVPCAIVTLVPDLYVL